MSLEIYNTALHLLPLRTRMPFRYGIATVHELHHAVLRVTMAVNGRRVEGCSADHLAPRWFVKEPSLSAGQERQLLLRSIHHAADLAREAGEVSTPFDLWWLVYHAQRDWARAEGVAPLVAAFGVSLVERAVIHAFCTAIGKPFGWALHDGSLGVQLERIYPALAGTQPRDYLPTEPRPRITVRHTVGLSDPLTETDIAPEERLDDGLPQSLQACIRTYRLTHFKVKLSGDPQFDHARLRQLARLLPQECPSYRFTLDANEMYPDIQSFRAFWEQLQADASLRDFLQRLIFVEQPLHRDEALTERTREELYRWKNHPPVIIDESDAELHTLAVALQYGYSGCSVKSCKGVFKGIANACLAEHLRLQGQQVLVSGEDLTTVPPVSLQQDLALMANLGIEHVERNGYHYFRGLSMLPQEQQERLLNDHPDLFTRHPQGFVTLRVTKGQLHTESVTAAPFGVAGCQAQERSEAGDVRQ
ncbi:MAG: hypothetical protein K6U75_10875 [Firmicutes bacterium]|nr:hypothetical protein [Bacillota bacterium]